MGVNAATQPILNELMHGLREVLAPETVGIYLYGSAVSGGFDPGVSDLDLVVLTKHAVEVLNLAGLERMHGDLERNHPEWADRIEVVYVDKATLGSFRTSASMLAVISPGEPFHVTGPALDWDQNWYLVREAGIALFGPPAADFVPPISRSEYVAAVARYSAWLARQDLDTLSSRSLAYTVLSLCRAWCTVETGEPCSKQDGAAWAKDRRPEWTEVIDTALLCRMARGTTGPSDAETRSAATRLILQLAARVQASNQPR